MRFLTRPTLLFLLVTIPVALSGNGVPAPDSVFGFRPGADYKLATYDQSVEYFKKLAASTKYVKLVEAGKTSQGRRPRTTSERSIATAKSRGVSRTRRG